MDRIGRQAMKKGEKIGLCFMLTAIFFAAASKEFTPSSLSIFYLIGVFGIGLGVFIYYGDNA